VVEQKAGTEQLAIREANMGIYCFRADLFWKHIDEVQPNNPAGEYYLTDMPAILTRAGHTVEAMQIDDPAEALGINDRAQLAMVDAILRERKRTDLMAAGVTLIKPETITIDSAVEIGMDTIVEPFAQILGRTTIGENCRIGACSIIQDSAGRCSGNRPLHRRQHVHTGAWREGRPVRASAHGKSRRSRRSHRQLRRTEKDPHARRC
jgi:bifunctional UDP-N-acetylglucosamine pyrophosphorylase/glucosamine-1-phosphate N-acetyltransferase